MDMYRALKARAEESRPVRVVVLGAGKFAAMFLAQAVRTPGLHIVGVADLNVSRARERLTSIGWDTARTGAETLDAALAQGSTVLTDDSGALLADERIDVVVEATGDPAAAIGHALAAAEIPAHFVNVTVEADVLAGPVLARRFAEAGRVYTLAYGDQPALIAELVDWARTTGFEVVAAGKGTRYLPAYHHVTPDTVWDHYGLSAEAAREGGLNPKMFNSFLDGTKSAIEMAAVANACGLDAPSTGLAFPPCGVDDLAHVLRPVLDGGSLETSGQVEVVSSLERDGRPVHRDLRWGVYVVLKAPDSYVRRCFAEYGLTTDASGWYAAMYKPFHLIGLELGISVARAALFGQTTGAPEAFRAEVATVAKRDLVPGDQLDGEGGYTVYGRLAPVKAGSPPALPIGLAHGLTVKRAIMRDTTIGIDAVEPLADTPAVRLWQQTRETPG